MIELTPEQAKAIETQQGPVEVQNPCTQQVLVLVRKDVFDLMKQWMAPLHQGWDDPAMDVYNDPAS